VYYYSVDTPRKAPDFDISYWWNNHPCQWFKL